MFCACLRILERLCRVAFRVDALDNRSFIWRSWTGRFGSAENPASQSGGFGSHFHPVYLLVLAMFAVVFTSVRLTVAWTTLVAAVFATLSWTVGTGLDLGANDEKDLLTRILMMYGIACAVQPDSQVRAHPAAGSGGAGAAAAARTHRAVANDP